MAQLGYGDGDEQSIVSYGPNINSKFLTTYFRKTFAVTNVNRIAALRLKLVVSDGALIYLNNAPLTNLNLAFGAVFDTPATAMPFALRDTWHSFDVDPRLLAEGTNTIAAEVHLASGTSTNMSFDLQLLATEAPYISAVSWLTNQAQLAIVGSSNSPTTIQSSEDFKTWSDVGSLLLTNGSGLFVDPQTENTTYRYYRAKRAIP